MATKAQRMQWRAFFYLAKGEQFDLNGKPFVKGGLFTCRDGNGNKQAIAPWRKVRTLRPVSKVTPKPGNEQGEHGPC